MNIQLIPKDYKKNQKDSSWLEFEIPIIKKTVSLNFLTSRKKSKIALIISIILVVLTGLAYGGLFYYQEYFLKVQKDDLQAQIDKVNSQRDFEFEKEFKDMGAFYESIKSLEKNHVYATRLFEALEELTLPKVQYLRLEANFISGKVSLPALAADFDSTYKQIFVLKEDSRIREVSSSGSSRDSNNQISFNLNLSFDQNFLKGEYNE